MARIELGGFSMVCILGGLAVEGGDLSWQQGAGLFLGNLFLVILGFVHNDYMDMDIDRRLDQLKKRPLVSGIISPSEARIMSWVVGLGNLILMGLWFRNPAAVAVMALAEGFCLLYNRFSKRVLGADLLYAASAACLALFGSVAVSPARSPMPDLTLWITVVAAIQFLEHLFFNVVSGQLKDLEYDREAGVMTLAVRFSEQTESGTRLAAGFRLGALGVKALSMSLIFLPALLGQVTYASWQWGVLGGLAAASLLRSFSILTPVLLDRKVILHRTKRQEMASKAMLPLLLLPWIGWGWMLMIIGLPMIWYAGWNYTLNRKFFGDPVTF
jgi:4-hydroxybenzoate polyprenyltransferase